ncbi:MAG: VOC family protein [Bryobacterales bacterium]|nr:VOC family protein [Bryobacterales bacterium]
MTRRLLLLSPAVLAAFQLRPAVQAVDHLIVGTRDLDAGIEWLSRKLGVRPASGGVHPGRGTWNALLALGGRQYLELIAPDPKQSKGGEDVVAQLSALDTPRLIGWAASVAGIDALAQRLRPSVPDVAAVADGSRRRGDGKLLAWKSLQVSRQRFSVVPFFIEWGSGSEHPSGDSPKGCTLQSVSFRHPQPEEFRALLAKMGLDAAVTRGDQSSLSAVLRTPKGTVTL